MKILLNKNLMNGKIKKNNFKIQEIKWKCKYGIPRINDLK